MDLTLCAMNFSIETYISHVPVPKKCLNSSVFSLTQVAELTPCCIKLSRCIIICRIGAKGSSYLYTNGNFLCMQFFGVLMQVSHLDTYTHHRARCVRLCNGYAALDFLCKCKNVPERLLKLTWTCVYLLFCITNWEIFVMKIENIRVKISEVPLYLRSLHQLKSSSLFIHITWSMTRKC